MCRLCLDAVSICLRTVLVCQVAVVPSNHDVCARPRWNSVVFSRSQQMAPVHIFVIPTSRHLIFPGFGVMASRRSDTVYGSFISSWLSSTSTCCVCCHLVAHYILQSSHCLALAAIAAESRVVAPSMTELSNRLSLHLTSCHGIPCVHHH